MKVKDKNSQSQVKKEKEIPGGQSPPEVPKLEVYNLEGEKVKTLEVEKKEIFGEKINKVAIREAILSYLANQRKGTVSTRTRGKVRGGGRKPWPQKGTGRARAGSIRSPLWVGGGVTFGPKPRDFGYSPPKKIKKIALRSLLQKRWEEKNLFLLEDLEVEKGKTKELVKILEKFPPGKRTLLVVEKAEENLKRAARNLPDVSLLLGKDLCPYDVFSHERIFITLPAFSILKERLKNE